MKEAMSDLSARAPDVNVDSFMAALPEHDDYLRGLVWSVVRDPNVIDDVMQTAYERAYRALGRFDGRSSFRTWLHTICYRTAVDHIRYQASRRSVSLDGLSDGSAASVTESITDEIVLGLEAGDLLARLDPEQRALLYYTAALGYSYDEVAEITGLSRGTVASRVSRAKARVRNGRSS